MTVIAKCPEKPIVRGVDVSHFQGQIDWVQVKRQSFQFAIVKATDGHTLTDPYYHSNIRKILKNDLYPGAYHFFRPSLDATRQAEHFIHVVGDQSKNCLPPTLDLELQGSLSPDDYCKSVSVWLNLVEKQYGRKCLIYSYPWFVKDYLRDEFKGHHLFYADYVTDPQAPEGWPITIQQTSEHGILDGICGDVDFDIFRGTLEQLKAL